MFGRWFRKRSIERELDEEFEAHFDLEAQLLRERGLTPAEAEMRARRSFGNKSQIAEQAREAWISRWFDRLSQDLRYAARTLLRNGAFTTAAVVSIALGVGAGTAVYSIADTVLLRPLPYRSPERLMFVSVRFPKRTMEFVGSPDYVPWRRDNHVFESLAATQAFGGQVMLLNGNDAAEVHDARVSANFLRTLGVRPALGRDFNPSEELPNGPKAVLLTHRLWRQRFHGDPRILGRSILMDGDSYSVIGVLPASFEFPIDEELDILTTLPVSPAASYSDREVMTWAVYGRLKQGVAIEQARADMERLFARSKAGMPPPFRAGSRAMVEPLRQHRVGNAGKLLAILIGAVTCLLLIACANVSNLLLARWAARSGELAIRAAIGAGRKRLARQLLTEASLLAGAGCACGMLLAAGVLRAFVHYAGNEVPRLAEVTLDLRVLAIGLLLSLIATLMFGGLPAWRAGRLDLLTALRESGRVGIVGGHSSIRRALVATEIALCLVLLSGASLLLQSLWHLRNDRLGFEPERVLSVSIPLKGTKLDHGDRAAFVSELLDYVRHIPGAEYAAETECTPLTGGPFIRTFSRSGRPLPEAFHPGDNISVCGVSADYAKAAGLRVLRGRFFSQDDFRHPNTMAVINEAAARAYFPGEEPIGKQIIGNRGVDWKTVIGVVSNSKNLGLGAPPMPQAFVNGPVSPGPGLQFVVRHIGDPRGLEDAMAGKLHRLDSGLMADFKPLTQEIAAMSGSARFNAVLVGSFAAIAFAMATIGVYGVLAFAVTQRTHEIGVRIALGGEPLRILRLVLRDGLGPVLAGIGAGLLAVLGTTRYLKALLYGVTATDPFTLAAVTMCLAIAAAIAISIPARRAARMNPVAALRHY